MSNIVTTPSHYLVLIVAHTSSTKVNVFEWDGSVTDPSTLHEVDLGDDQMYLISEPGLHDIGTDQIALAVHFAPLVSNMKKFFEARNAPSATIPVHIFLVASGLRHIASDTDAAALLRNSYDIIKSLCPPPYNVGSQATNAIIPSVAVKSAFAWGGLVYCRRLSNERCMSDIPSCRAGGTIAIVPQGDHLLISLEHKDWGTDLPLLSSSHWETGAAALIIRNNMSLDEENLTSEDHLPPVEFAVDGSVRVKSSAMAPSKTSGQSPLYHQIHHHRVQEAHGQQGTLEQVSGGGDLAAASPPRIGLLIQAAEITSNALKDREIEHSYFGAFASSLLGSSRAAHDIDVILDSSLFLNDDEELDEAGVEAVRDAIQAALQAANCHSAVVETVLQDSKSIPKVSEQDMSATKQGLPLLRPEFLFMSKLNSWGSKYGSPGPESLAALSKDAEDIDHLLGYLNKPHWLGVVSFAEYKSHEGVAESRQTLIEIAAKFFLQKSRNDLDKELPLFKRILVPADLKSFEVEMEKGTKR